MAATTIGYRPTKKQIESDKKSVKSREAKQSNELPAEDVGKGDAESDKTDVEPDKTAK